MIRPRAPSSSSTWRPKTSSRNMLLARWLKSAWQKAYVISCHLHTTSPLKRRRWVCAHGHVNNFSSLAQCAYSTERTSAISMRKGACCLPTQLKYTCQERTRPATSQWCCLAIRCTNGFHPRVLNSCCRNREVASHIVDKAENYHATADTP